MCSFSPAVVLLSEGFVFFNAFSTVIIYPGKKPWHISTENTQKKKKNLSQQNDLVGGRNVMSPNASFPITMEQKKTKLQQRDGQMGSWENFSGILSGK